MEPYIEFIGTLQNSGFWLVKVAIHAPKANKAESGVVRSLCEPHFGWRGVWLGLVLGTTPIWILSIPGKPVTDN